MIEKLIEDIKNAKIINQEMKNQILDQLQEFKTYKELEADGKLCKTSLQSWTNFILC